VLGQTFDPFGNVLAQTGSGQSVFGFTGEQTDPAGLVFLRARYYDPGVGRFLTADSVVPDPLRSGGWNRYAYVGNNPTNYIDPSGHCFLFGVDTLACVGIWTFITVGGAAAFGSSLYLHQHRDEIRESLDSLRLPGFNLLSPDENPQLVTEPDDIQWCFNPFPMDQVGLPTTLPGPSFDAPWPGGNPPGFYTNPEPLPNVYPQIGGGRGWGVGASQTKVIKGYEVRVDWESPGRDGNVHVTVDGRKIFISDPQNLSGLPKSLRKNEWVQNQVHHAFEQMRRFESQ
jgi:RHS repeat-associated protein